MISSAGRLLKKKNLLMEDRKHIIQTICDVIFSCQRDAFFFFFLGRGVGQPMLGCGFSLHSFINLDSVVGMGHMKPHT